MTDTIKINETLTTEVPKRKKISKTFKPAKTISEQLSHLELSKKVVYEKISKQDAGDILLKYNYINVITPFKHHFAKKNNNYCIKNKDGKHIYENKVDFNEYLKLYKEERSKYPRIIEKIIEFESHFKAITAYHILNCFEIKNYNDVSVFVSTLLQRLEKHQVEGFKYARRIEHMKTQLNTIESDTYKYADIYCYFDRMSLGQCVTIFLSLQHHIQNLIFDDLLKFNQTLRSDRVTTFIDKIFTLVSIRNCVMHCNSLEILVRFYNPKTHDLRRATDKKRYVSLIKFLSSP